MRSFFKDLQLSFRSLMQRPRYALMAVLYLTLGLAVNAAIFSIFKHVLLDPLPYEDPGRLLVILDRAEQGDDSINLMVSSWTYATRKENTRVFDNIVAARPWTAPIGSEGGTTVAGASVSSGFFSLLGVEIWRGREIALGEDFPGGDRVVVLSHGFWREEFAADDSALGQRLVVNGEPHTIIGILPPGYHDPFITAQIWTGLQIDPADSSDQNRFDSSLMTFGRLREGADREQAVEDLRRISRQMAEAFPKTHSNLEAGLYPLRQLLSGEVRLQLWALQIAAFFVLLISCINLSCLLLVRSEEQGREMAVRAAFGASRWQLMRLWLAEGVLIAGCAGLLGVLVAVFLLRLVPDTSSLVAFSSSFHHVEIDFGVVVFSTVLVALVSLVFGIVPVLRRSGFQLTQHLGSGQRSGAGRQRNRFFTALVMVEIALAVVLTIGTGLMLKSFWRLTGVETGFRAENVLTFTVDLPSQRYPEGARRVEFVRQVEERVGALQGIESASFSSNLPFSGGDPGYTTLMVRDIPRTPDSELLFAISSLVTNDHFEALGIPLLDGRVFGDRDQAGVSSSVVIVSESMANRFWPGEDPIGKELKRGARPRPDIPWSTVIGVVGDIKFQSLRSEPEAIFYFPLGQYADHVTARQVHLVVRHEARAADLRPTIVRILKDIDPVLDIDQVSTMTEFGRATVFRHRLLTSLIAGSGMCALLLAILGIYGVISFTVAQRRHEMGIRLALGAEPASVGRLILRWGMLVAGVGLLIGWLGAGGLTRVLASQLYQVESVDLTVYLGTGLLLVAIALLACYLPARRAASTNPNEALRHQ